MTPYGGVPAGMPLKILVEMDTEYSSVIGRERSCCISDVIPEDFRFDRPGTDTYGFMNIGAVLKTL